MTLEIQNTPVDRIQSLIDLLSVNNKEENNDECIVVDVWNKIILLLNTKDIKNFSLVSRNLCILILKSASYVWHVCNKPKLCTVISRSILDMNTSMFLSDRDLIDTSKITSNFIEILLKSGITDVARKMARRCGDGKYHTSQLMYTIAQHQIQQGDIEEKKKSLEEAKKSFIKARDWASKISDIYHQEIILEDIVKMQARCGDIENAKETLKCIVIRKYTQCKACIHIAQGQIQYGHINSAIETIREIISKNGLLKSENKRNKILREIDRLLIDMGDIPSANNEAQWLSKSCSRSKALWSIQMRGLLQNGEVDEAKKMFIDKRKKILQGNSTDKEDTLRYIAAFQSEIDSDGAKSTLKEAKNMMLQSEVSGNTINQLIRIAEEEMQYGDIEDAKNTLRNAVQMTRQIKLKPRILNEIIWFLIELDDIATAKDVVLRIPDTYKKTIIPNYNRASALHSIAKAQFKKNDRNEAASTLKEAKNAALLISDSRFRAKVLIKIAQTTFKYDTIEEGEDIFDIIEKDIELISDVYHKARSIINIAALRSQINGIHAVESTLSIIVEEYAFENTIDRDKALSAIFRLYFQFDAIDNLVEIFNAITYDSTMVDTILQVMDIIEGRIEDNGLTRLSSFTKRISK